MAATLCRYCVGIRARDRRYRPRRATHAIGSDFPRCDFHWRFVCDVCGEARIFHVIAFCPRRDRWFCIECAPENRTIPARFWAWSYFYSLRCPWCNAWHAALDRQEHDGRHPWQVRPSWRRTKRGLSTSDDIPARWSFRVGPFDRVTDRDIRHGWDDVSTWWIPRYSDKGDINREWVIDPALLRILGDVRGRRILDAGCGGGYLSRILAKRGATVTGVDVSPKLLAEAEAREAHEPLGIRYLRRDLANLSGLRGGTVDLVVSNVVLQDVRRLREAIREIHRVLRRHGRFVFSITHPAFDIPPAHWVREPPDTERPEERPFMAVDRYFDRVALYWAPSGQPEVVSFHRPLSEFAEVLHDAGFVIDRLEEPRPPPEALERRYRQFADQTRIPNFLIIEARKA